MKVRKLYYNTYELRVNRGKWEVVRIKPAKGTYVGKRLKPYNNGSTVKLCHNGKNKQINVLKYI